MANPADGFADGSSVPVYCNGNTAPDKDRDEVLSFQTEDVEAFEQLTPELAPHVLDKRAADQAEELTGFRLIRTPYPGQRIGWTLQTNIWGTVLTNDMVSRIGTQKCKETLLRLILQVSVVACDPVV